MTDEMQELVRALRGGDGFLLDGRERGSDLIGRARVGGTTYRVRCWRCGTLNGQTKWAMQFTPASPDASRATEQPQAAQEPRQAPDASTRMQRLY